MSSNGGFPPLKIIKKNDNNKELKKERHFKSNNINLNIKNILSSSVVKPMIDLNKQPVEKVIDTL